MYFAKLAEQAERYDEMADHMLDAVGLSPDLSTEEMNLFSVAYKLAVGSRRAAWRIAVGNQQNEVEATAQKCMREYRVKVEGELDRICSSARDTVSCALQENAKTDEAKVFYHKMKAEAFRDLALCKEGEVAKQRVAESAKQAYEEASEAASSLLPETHPLRFGLALSHSVFNSQVLNNPEEACRAAPTALRNVSSLASVGGGLSPRGPTPIATVVQRLCDLLLEFPVASMGGVRWSILVSVYAEVYGEPLSHQRLGYASPAQAARALLADVLKCQPPEAGRADGVKNDDVDDPLLEVEDEIALTPLPGFAGSWPCLYRTLCAIVQESGQLLEEAGGESRGGSAEETPARVLLMSQLRPLLQGAAANADASSDVAGPVRSLLAQLRSVSQLRGSSGDRGGGGDVDGLCFRDEDGVFRRLQKMGHWAKAVLLWREQRIQWRHKVGRGTRCDAVGALSNRAKVGADASEIDCALSPNLELVFSKRFNNLVLRLSNEAPMAQKSPEVAKVPRAGGEQCASSATRRVAGMQARRHFDNPFKWEPPAAATAPTTPVKPPASAPHVSAQDEADAPSAAAAATASDARASAAAASVAAASLFSSPARGRRPPSRARETSRSSATETPRRGRAARGRSTTWTTSRPSMRQYASESASTDAKRGQSEPPQPRWADVFDDPFEPPPEEGWQWENQVTPLPLFAVASSGHGCAPALETPPPRPNPGPRCLNPLPTIVAGRDPTPRRGRARSRPKFSRTGASEVSPSPFGATTATRASSLQGRAETYIGDLEPASPVGELVRCHSEPPQLRWAEVFDDPFEPPPQEPWTARDKPAQNSDASPLARFQIPASSTVVLGMEDQPAQLRQPCLAAIVATPVLDAKWYAAPPPPALMIAAAAAFSCGTVPAAAAAAAPGMMRARSLTRDAGDAADALLGCAPSRGRAEHRSHSEPPQPFDVEVFDDPFEPPPQVRPWLSNTL